MDEDGGYHIGVGAIKYFGGINDGEEWYITFMIEEIGDKEGFTGAAFADEEDDGVIGDHIHAELA